MKTPILPKLIGTHYEIDRALLVRHRVLVQPEEAGIDGTFDQHDIDYLSTVTVAAWWLDNQRRLLMGGYLKLEDWQRMKRI